MNNIDWDDLQRQYYGSNSSCPWIDDDGYRGTGITKEEWEEAKYDNEED